MEREGTWGNFKNYRTSSYPIEVVYLFVSLRGRVWDESSIMNNNMLMESQFSVRIV